MTATRKTMRELHEEKSEAARAEVTEAIASGSMTVRQMTADERLDADERRAAAVARTAKRSKSKR